MTTITFCTGNQEKLEAGRAICQLYDIKIEHHNIDIDEVQGEDFDYIAAKKAEAAYQKVKSPIIVTDDCYDFPGLNGFPGPYMHSINEWFSVENFVHLITGMDDKRFFVHKSLVYYDGKKMKSFKTIFEGKLITTPRGESKFNSHKVMMLESDNGQTIAEVIQDKTKVNKRKVLQNWHDFAKWHTSSVKT